jgi:rSAM/selenodomain-associated transferase 2
MKISVIIPVLNEETAIRKMLPEIQWIRESGSELIVVDGGSADDSVSLAEKYSDAVIVSTKGRAAQMNAGAKIATGDILLFLHIDTVLSPDSLNHILTSINCVKGKNNIQGKRAWGRFDVRLSGSHFMFRIIEAMMNWRSRITGIATGDQAIFITKELFEHEISRRLKKICKPVCIQERVIASSRRWEVSGIYRTVFLMWRLRLSYWLGVDPVRLVKEYYG